MLSASFWLFGAVAVLAKAITLARRCHELYPKVKETAKKFKWRAGKQLAQQKRTIADLQLKLHNATSCYVRPKRARSTKKTYGFYRISDFGGIRLAILRNCGYASLRSTILMTLDCEKKPISRQSLAQWELNAGATIQVAAAAWHRFHMRRLAHEHTYGFAEEWNDRRRIFTWQMHTIRGDIT